MNSENSVHYRHILLYSYRRGTKATQVCERICDVYGRRAIDVSTCRRWYRRFKDGNYDLEDAPRSGRPNVENVQLIIEKVEQNPKLSSHEVAKTLHISHGTVLNHLQKAGYVKIKDNWEKLQTVDKKNDNICTDKDLNQ